MNLKNEKVNHLNALGIRQVEFPAHHFVYTHLNNFNSIKVFKIKKWIEYNLKGRYYIGQNLSLTDNVFVYNTLIGFENEKELTFFKIAYSDLT
jgi:hypothetical protein